MKQRIYILFILSICWFITNELYGQTHRNDTIQVGLQVTQPKGLQSDKASRILQGRLEQAVVLNGAARDDSPFQLETEAVLRSCQTAPSTPIQIITELEIACSITDKLKGQTVRQATFLFKGIGSTKDEAILNATKQLRARDPQLKKLIVNGKEKLMDSYRIELQQIEKPQNIQE